MPTSSPGTFSIRRARCPAAICRNRPISSMNVLIRPVRSRCASASRSAKLIRCSSPGPMPHAVISAASAWRSSAARAAPDRSAARIPGAAPASAWDAACLAAAASCPACSAAPIAAATPSAASSGTDPSSPAASPAAAMAAATPPAAARSCSAARAAASAAC